MQEELITLEVAKLAKEKGFNIPTSEAFINQKPFTNFEEFRGDFDGVRFEVEDFKKNWNAPNTLYTEYGSLSYGCQSKKNYFEACSRPTQALLQKWLREKHKTHIRIEVFLNGYTPQLFEVVLGSKAYQITETSASQGLTYEQALEEGLLAALKLIK